MLRAILIINPKNLSRIHVIREFFRIFAAQYCNQTKTNSKALNWYRNKWYYVGGGIFVVLAIVMALFGEHVDPVRRIMIVGFMGLIIHQFEEYVLPGGFPMVWNIVQSGEREIYDRYPMNKNTSFVCNVCIMYPLYISGIIFSDC